MELKELNINEIKPNPFQPREKFDKEKLQELADNLSKHGLIEPIVVTKKGSSYLIVAGERRWRASKLAKKDRIYALIKDYTSDVDIKRDSLVENEMRENLSNEEFKAFVFSLAKSLGEPYYNKGYINVAELTRYITGPRTKLDDSPFRRKLSRMLDIETKASSKVKRYLEEGRIDLATASHLSNIEDKSTQDEIAELAKTKDKKEIRAEIKRHNFKQKAEQLTKELSKETEEEVKRKSEIGIVSKFCNKINSWNDEINYLAENIKDNRSSFIKFSHESRMEMLDSLKPLRRDLEKTLHLVDKLMGEMAK